MTVADEKLLKSPVKALAARASRPGESSRLAAASALETKVRDRLATYAPNTQRALKADWTVWHSWCVEPSNHEDGRPRDAFPITPAALVEFIYAHSPGEVRAADGTRRVDESLTHGRVRSPRTLARYLASLRALHRLAGYKDDPTADADVEAGRRLVMRGRTRAKPKQPLRLALIDQALASPATTARMARDRAMLAVAYSAMLRRSELVAMTVADIRFDTDASGTATIRHSKRDQAGEGQVRYLAPFAVTALKTWRNEAQIETGPLFRAILPIGTLAEKALTAHEVSRIFKRLAEALQLDGSTVGAIGGHSTRIGAAHDLVVAGFDVASIANSGGWKSLLMPNYYTRELRAKLSAMARFVKHRNADSDSPPTNAER